MLSIPHQFREERLKLRREIASLPAEELEKKKKNTTTKAKETKTKVEKTDVVDVKIEVRELTEYKKLRLQKIKRVTFCCIFFDLFERFYGSGLMA